jgi:uncharacterized protein YkwD
MLTRRLAVALTAASALFVAPAAAHAASPTERAVIRLMNQARARHGLPVLHASAPLARAAEGHSRDMLAHDFFAHESSDGTSFDRRVRAYEPARQIGENLAMVSRVQRVARQVVSMWLHSPPHRGVLLSADYRRVGVGERSGRLGNVRATVVTVDFASRR